MAELACADRIQQTEGVTLADLNGLKVITDKVNEKLFKGRRKICAKCILTADWSMVTP
jgi:hypothetical protein